MNSLDIIPDPLQSAETLMAEGKHLKALAHARRANIKLQSGYHQVLYQLLVIAFRSAIGMWKDDDERNELFKTDIWRNHCDEEPQSLPDLVYECVIFLEADTCTRIKTAQRHARVMRYLATRQLSPSEALAELRAKGIQKLDEEQSISDEPDVAEEGEERKQSAQGGTDGEEPGFVVQTEMDPAEIRNCAKRSPKGRARATVLIRPVGKGFRYMFSELQPLK